MNHTPIIFPGLGLQFNPNRVAFTLFGHSVYWYGIIIAIGFILAVLYCYSRAKRFGVNPDRLVDMLLFAVPIAIVGLRAYYVIFNFSIYQYKQNGKLVTDWGAVFRLWDGGLAIYGGIIAAVITAVVFCRVNHIKFGAMADLSALGLLIGQAIGRWGNFINREAFGGVTDVAWRMGVTPRGGTYIEVHPTFFYESMWNLIGFLLLAWISKKWRKFDGQIFLLYIAWYGLGRGFIEGLRSDSLYLFSTGIRVSQLVAFASCAVAVVLLVYNLLVKKHQPEELASWQAEHPAAAEIAGTAAEAGEAGTVETAEVTEAAGFEEPEAVPEPDKAAEPPEPEANPGEQPPAGPAAPEIPEENTEKKGE